MDVVLFWSGVDQFHPYPSGLLYVRWDNRTPQCHGNTRERYGFMGHINKTIKDNKTVGTIWGIYSTISDGQYYLRISLLFAFRDTIPTIVQDSGAAQTLHKTGNWKGNLAIAYLPKLIATFENVKPIIAIHRRTCDLLSSFMNVGHFCDW